MGRNQIPKTNREGKKKQSQISVMKIDTKSLKQSD